MEELQIHRDANKAIDELVSHLQQNLKTRCDITVTEVVKGGSLGHGTAIPGNFDIDLVLYSRDIDAEDVKINGYGKWLTKLHWFLEETIPKKYHHTKTTDHAVQFVYDGRIEIDLLVSPFWESPHDLYRFLKTVRPKSKRFDFSVYASKWQVEFFKDQPNEVKEYIKKAKAWRNKMWPKSTGGNGKPRSYLLSLLVVRAYERSPKGRKKRPQLPMRITRELQNIVTSDKMNIHWEDGRAGKRHCYRRRDYSSLLPSRPRLIDPANPSNNLYKTGIGRYKPNERASDYEMGDGNWTLFKEYIHTLDLSKPLEEWL